MAKSAHENKKKTTQPEEVVSFDTEELIREEITPMPSI